MKPAHRFINRKDSPAPIEAITEDAAMQAMWLYYRDHKPQLISDIRDYRAGILAKLMEGAAVEDAFASYFRTAEPAKTLRRAA
jgi:hypothetical protein